MIRPAANHLLSPSTDGKYYYYYCLIHAEKGSPDSEAISILIIPAKATIRFMRVPLHIISANYGGNEFGSINHLFDRLIP